MKKLILVVSILSVATITAIAEDTTKLQQFITKWVGKPYRYGGRTEKGIDCSAFTQRFYKDMYDVQIPRTSKTQMQYAEIINKKELQVGDILFFDSRYSPSRRHVGIYIGNDQFIHAANYRDGVKVSCLYDYEKIWKKVGRFVK